MGDLAKITLFFAALWGIDTWNHLADRGKDFDECNEKAAQVLFVEKTPPSLLLLPPDLTLHDQADELIQRCMLAKDYDYLPDGWKDCPTEKLPACYEKPSLAIRMLRAIK